MSTEESIPQYEGPASYRGPSMKYLMDHHLLAAKIIELHPRAPDCILDSDNLALLRDYVNNPEAKLDLLRARDVDVDTVWDKGQLVAYVMVHDKFDENDMNMLREFFANPQIDEDLKDPRWA
jgi:hypothetical protein